MGSLKMLAKECKNMCMRAREATFRARCGDGFCWIRNGRLFGSKAKFFSPLLQATSCHPKRGCARVRRLVVGPNFQQHAQHAQASTAAVREGDATR